MKKVVLSLFFILLFVTSASPLSGVSNKVVVVNNDKSFADQVVSANSIYLIRGEFDLRAKTITIPKNCVLRFEDGCLKNGTIKGDNTYIDAPSKRVFNRVGLSGSFIAENDVRVSWWVNDADKENTKNVQRFLDAVSSFPQNKEFVFDKPVVVSDLSYIDKYSPYVVFRGNTSRQQLYDITIKGRGSNGLDFSGTTSIRLRDLYIVGDTKEIPNCLVYCARTNVFNSCGDYVIENVKFGGCSKFAHFYDYSGESIRFINCDFIGTEQSQHDNYLVYLTAVNSKGLKSRFTDIYNKTTPCTGHSFQNCIFRDITRQGGNGVLWEGQDLKESADYNVSKSGLFLNCYFGMPYGIPLHLVNYRGSLNIISCIDESRSNNNSIDLPLIKIEKFGKNVIFRGLNIIGCSFYPNSYIIDGRDVQIENLSYLGNTTTKKSRVWFKRISGSYISAHVGLIIKSTEAVRDTQVSCPTKDTDKYIEFPGGWYKPNGDLSNWRETGKFSERPKDGSIPLRVGFRYFCTDRKTVESDSYGIEIIYKGNNTWVDALGRIIK